MTYWVVPLFIAFAAICGCLRLACAALANALAYQHGFELSCRFIFGLSLFCCCA